MDFKKLTDTELENITGGGKTKIKITTKEKHYNDDSLTYFARMCTESPVGGIVGGTFLIIFGALVFGISVHRLKNNR